MRKKPKYKSLFIHYTSTTDTLHQEYNYDVPVEKDLHTPSHIHAVLLVW